MTAKKQAMTYEQEVTNDTVIDYTANMFADGNNRTGKDKTIRNAKDYDDAVQVADPAITDALTNETTLAVSDAGMVDVARSRDGTEASGVLDEDGGSLGGTEAELDSMEANAAPVDRTPQMKR